MEQIYQDFTTKLLPKIAEGLVITKEYFFDLFGRYVQYLIVKDSLLSALGMMATIGGAILFYQGIKYGRKHDWRHVIEMVLILFGSLMFIYGICGSIIKAGDLIKDFYIPEVRVYEEISSNR